MHFNYSEVSSPNLPPFLLCKHVSLATWPIKPLQINFLFPVQHPQHPSRKLDCLHYSYNDVIDVVYIHTQSAIWPQFLGTWWACFWAFLHRRTAGATQSHPRCFLKLSLEMAILSASFGCTHPVSYVHPFCWSRTYLQRTLQEVTSQNEIYMPRYISGNG